MKELFRIFIAIIITGCNSHDASKDQQTINTPKDTVPSHLTEGSLAGCYMMVISKDTAYMHLDDSSGFLRGHLSYKRFEKDSNRGVVTLSRNGNELTGWYNFASEGSISVREIIFKIRDGSFAEGYGDVAMKNDSVSFKYPSALKFEEAHPFIKKDCK